MTVPNTDPLQAQPCKGTGLQWDHLRGRVRPGPCCPVCDATPATLRVPEPEQRNNDTDIVPEHPNMVVWAGRVDVVRWRQIRAAMRDGS
jgi:hypothetical protein